MKACLGLKPKEVEHAAPVRKVPRKINDMNKKEKSELVKYFVEQYDRGNLPSFLNDGDVKKKIKEIAKEQHLFEKLFFSLLVFLGFITLQWIALSTFSEKLPESLVTVEVLVAIPLLYLTLLAGHVRLTRFMDSEYDYLKAVREAQSILKHCYCSCLYDKPFGFSSIYFEKYFACVLSEEIQAWVREVLIRDALGFLEEKARTEEIRRVSGLAPLESDTFDPSLVGHRDTYKRHHEVFYLCQLITTDKWDDFWKEARQRLDDEKAKEAQAKEQKENALHPATT